MIANARKFPFVFASGLRISIYAQWRGSHTRAPPGFSIICGIPNFAISFWTDAASREIPIGDDGRFVERFNFTCRSHGKKYPVLATSSGEFATFSQDPAYNPDQVRFKQTATVKRVRKGARRCKAKAHSWIGFKA